MKMTDIYFVEAVFMEACCRQLQQHLQPGRPLFWLLFLQSLTPVTLGHQRGEAPEETQQDLVTITPCPLSPCVQPGERARKPQYHASIIRNCTSYKILKADFERVIYTKHRTILRNPSTFQLILLWFETKKNTFSGKSILGLFLLKATSS